MAMDNQEYHQLHCTVHWQILQLQCLGRILIRSQHQSQNWHSVSGFGDQVEIYDKLGTGANFLLLLTTKASSW